MKIWIKYLIGCVMGLFLFLFVPFTSDASVDFLQFFTDLSIQIGRYFLLPLLFFSMTVAVTKLRNSRKLFRISLRIISVGFLITIAITLLGLISILIIDLPRIPISIEKIDDTIRLDVPNLIRALFPVNGVGGLLDGAYLLPLYVLAGFLGAGFASDQIRAKPAYILFDSLSKVCYSIVSFFTDFLAIGMIAISSTWFIQFFDTINSGAYTGLIILLAVDTILVIGGLLPLMLHIMCKEKHPYKVLYASIAPIFTALFSGNANFSLPVAIRHAKGSLGIERKIGTISLPIFSTFVRSGSALVIVVSFIAVLRSYSSLGISSSDILWLTAMSIGISFLLGAIPVGGPFIALTILCTIYGNGFEAGYLLLKPVAFIICTFSAVIDTTVGMFSTYLIAQKEKMITPKKVSRYV